MKQHIVYNFIEYIFLHYNFSHTKNFRPCI